MLVKYTDSFEEMNTTEESSTLQDNQQEEMVIENNEPVVVETTTQDVNNIKRLNYLGRDQNVKDS